MTTINVFSELFVSRATKELVRAADHASPYFEQEMSDLLADALMEYAKRRNTTTDKLVAKLAKDFIEEIEKDFA